MKSSMDSMIFRLKDTYGFLDTYIDKTNNQILVEGDVMSEFLIRALMTLMCNQAAIITYFLEKEGHPGLPGEVEVKKEET